MFRASPDVKKGSDEYRWSSGLALVLAGTALTAACSTPNSPNSHADNSAVCKKFGVYAQDRWNPVGTAVRESPDVLAPKIDPGFAPNEVIAVDGWTEADHPAYPTNTPPWNSAVWYHLANRAGWVSFAGVRGEPTALDPTGRADGGQPAPLPAACQEPYPS